MLRLFMYQPGAQRHSVARLLPPGTREFNWFFFGKRVFDPRTQKHVLHVDARTQFYDPRTGATYEVVDPRGAAFLLTDSLSGQTFRECREHGYAGHAYSSAKLLRPPMSPDVQFVALPHALAALAVVDDAGRVNLLRYVAREAKHVPGKTPPQNIAAQTKTAYSATVRWWAEG